MKIGDVLEMDVVQVESYDYGSIIKLSYDGRDSYRVKAYDFQSEGDLSATIKVKVTGIDPIRGYPYLVQDTGWVLSQTFEASDLIGRNYEFEIIDKQVDPNSNAPYIYLKDDFGLRTHRFYIDNNDEYNIGERIRLHIKCINKKARTPYLVLEKPKERTKISTDLVFTTREQIAVPSTSSTSQPTNRSISIVLPETETHSVEFKSSIVFDSNSGCIDIDKQIKKILIAIAGFMNADGGTLYIGVKDDSSIRGIEDDFQYLNEGEDKYAKQYSQNLDGFQLKIRNAISQYLSSMAGSLFSFETKTENAKTIAIITIHKAYVPIYYNGTHIYQRQGNRTKLLRDNALTNFCASRWFSNVSSAELPVKDTKRSQATHIDNDSTTRDYSIWHTLNLHKNGGWSFDDKGPNDLGEVICKCAIEKFREKEKHLILFAYASGNIDAVPLGTIQQIVNGKIKSTEPKWKNNRQGYGANGHIVEQDIQNVFCANPMDMVAVFYTKDDKSYVKVVDISSITVHPNFNNQGNEIVPNGVNDCKIFLVHHKYHDILRGLTRAVRNYKGYDIDNDRKLRPTIQKLQEIIKEEYGVKFE